MRFRVLPNDLHRQRHMSNGVYLSIMDLGRMDLMLRSGVWPELRPRGYCPVVASSTIAYRRSLDPDHHPLPEWLAEWSGHAALPSRREPAPSIGE